MSYKRKILIFCVLFSTFTVAAYTPVTLIGRVNFAQKGVLRVYAYDDLLLPTKVQIAEGTIEDDGSFKIQLPIQETQMIELAYNTIYTSLYVEPEKKYQFSLSADSLLISRIDAQQFGGGLYLRFDNIDTNELNYKIARFDKYYNYFINIFSNYSFEQIRETAYDSLLSMLKIRFDDDNIPTDFFSMYKHYKYALLDMLYYHKNPIKLYEKYLSGEYVHYNNIAYMDFINYFFDSYLYRASKYISQSVLHNDINEQKNCLKLLDDMGKDPILVNERIRELVFIKGMGELYDVEEFSRSSILLMLKQLATYTKFETHRKMAKNTIQNLTNLKHGMPASDVEWRDVYNSIVKLSDFRGKYLYVHCFATYSQSSIREMLILKEMYAQFKDSIEIVSVMLDFESTKLYHFVNEYKDFDWTFVHCNGNFSFIDKYRTYALPMGILIDANGNIVSYPAKSLSDGLLVQIYTLFPNLIEKNKSEKR